LGALPSLLCIVGNKSRGALDNASGVAAVLMAARLIQPARNLGVLLTSGEELDLAGARAWTADQPPGAGAGAGAMLINCDTVDDEGGWRLMYVTHPHALDMASQRAAKKLGLPLRMGRVIPGIITDSHAFETGGLPSVTLSRGTVRTLARLHTAGDNPDRLSGLGAATAARILAQMVEELS
jgi:Zn-dependent M28 family amino/carboxypeptidase